LIATLVSNGAKLDDQIAASNRLIDAAHGRDIPVIFSSVSYSKAATI
jgi:hypothetical protein